MKTLTHAVLLAGLLIFLTVPVADAHRSGCHRWHSCPSDHGTYVCGDTGHCSQCPDNEYCKNQQPRRQPQKESDTKKRSDGYSKPDRRY